MECPLCIDTIKKPVTCCGCNYTTCAPCAEKYLLLQPVGAHCMNPDCAIKWTTKFLLTMFSKTWVTKTYRSHLKKISLERERAKLPETLAQVPRYKKEKEQKKEIEKLRTGDGAPKGLRFAVRVGRGRFLELGDRFLFPLVKNEKKCFSLFI